jgi:hypothetical protein
VATARCLVPRECHLVSPKSRKLRSVSSSRSACVKTRSVSSGVWRFRAVGFPLSLPIRALRLDRFEGGTSSLYLLCGAF